MIKMTNGIDTIEIPSGAEKLYAANGFKRVKSKAAKKQEKQDEVVANDDVEAAEEDEVVEADEADAAEADGDDDDSKFVEEVEDKPLSQWKKDEIVKYAELKGIDISGTKNANEAKAIIKEAIEASV